MKKEKSGFSIFHIVIAFLIILLMVGGLGTAAESDGKGWKFRSDNHNSGVYDDGGKRPEGVFLWSYSTGEWVYSSPAVVGGVVYVGSNDQKVYAFNAATGVNLWNFSTGGAVSSSPAVADGTVYVGSRGSHKIYALDAMTGAKIWEFSTADEVSSSPAVADGIVYIGSLDHKVYALNATTGAKIWDFTDRYSLTSSPAVAGGVVYIGSRGGKVYALDAMTGAKLWEFSTGRSVESSPAVVGGFVYFGCADRKVYALNATTGAKLWDFTTGGDVDSSPAVANGVVYVGSWDGKIYALNATTGVKLWDFATRDIIISSPAVANGVVYVGSLDRNVYALDAITGAKLWNFLTGWFVYSSPAVADGVVYFGSYDGNIYALGSSPEITPTSTTVIPTSTIPTTTIPTTTIPTTLPTIPPEYDVTVDVDRNSDKSDPNITVTFKGGPGTNFVAVLYGIVTLPDGTVIQNQINTPKVNDRLILPGSTFVDRVQVLYKHSDGTMYTIYDQLLPFPTATPLPTITSLNPASIKAGSDDFTLEITGTNFVTGAKVLWEGQERTTAFVSSTKLTATIFKADVETAGAYKVKVKNPDGALSGELFFTVTEDTPLTGPNVNTFTVNPLSGPVGQKFTISGSVSAGEEALLQRVELWRNSADPLNQDDWVKIDEDTSLQGLSSGGYSFENITDSPGDYWYGIHVVDTNGWAHEGGGNNLSDGKPIKVTVIAVVDYDQPIFKAPWVGTTQIWQGYNGYSHKQYQNWENIYALDLGLVREEVLAAADGKVKSINRDATLQSGRYVILSHIGQNGEKLFYTYYGHLEDIYVCEEQSVTQGQRIGLSGNTGYHLENGVKKKIGYHLHFHLSDSSFDPSLSTEPIQYFLMKQKNIDADFIRYDGRTGELEDKVLVPIYPPTNDPENYYESNNIPFGTKTSTLNGMCIKATGNSPCPVEIQIIDPDGLILNQTFNDIPNASYSHVDLDGDDELDILITFLETKEGIYSILVIPLGDAEPSERFSIQLFHYNHTSENPYIIADNVRIDSIPSSPYFYNSVHVPISQTVSFFDFKEGIQPLSIVFTDNSTGNITSRYWSFGDGTFAENVTEVTHTYPSPGNYTVNLTVSGPDGENSTSQVITVVPLLIPPDGITNLHNTTYLPDSITWTWTDPASADFDHVMIYLEEVFQDNLTSGIQVFTASGLNPSKSYTIGIRTVGTTGLINETWINHTAMTAPDSGPDISTPEAHFIANSTSGNAPLTVEFNDASTGNIASYAWDFNNDGSIDSTVKDPIYSYANPGTYTVNLTVTGPGGMDSEVRTNYITVTEAQESISAQFTASPLSGNRPLVVRFTDQSFGNITSYAWDFNNDGRVDSRTKNPTKFYLSTGNYTVKLTVSGPDGVDEEIKEGYIHVGIKQKAPIARFSQDKRLGSAPLTVQFTDRSLNNPDTFLWNFGDGTTSTEKNPTHTYSVSGFFKVSLTASNEMGDGSAKGSVIVRGPWISRFSIP